MNIASFFSGCGGLDLGFERAGFDVIWANDNSRTVWETYERNFPDSILNKESIRKISIDDIPNNIVGIIGGPPCQSWSYAGNGGGINDDRGLLFFNYIEIIEEKQPLFFVAENVPGLLSKKNIDAFNLIKNRFADAGYVVKAQVLNSADYLVPQNRQRVFIVGYRYDIDKEFVFPTPNQNRVSVRRAISDLANNAIPALSFNRSNKDRCVVPNHEYFEGTYSYIFMSRNRVLSWDDQSYTIQASGRQMSIHPQAPMMQKVEKDVMRFVRGSEHLYRRLTVREAARIQTFPDDFIFEYDSLDAGYKMIGNSVPVNMAQAIAESIYADMDEIIERQGCNQNINLIPQQNVRV